MKNIAIGAWSLFLLTTFSCKTQPTIKPKDLVGKWNITDIYHPMIEEEYEYTMKYLDTLSAPELGQIAMWNTNDLAVIKEKEKEITERNHQQMKAMMLKVKYEFLEHNLMIKIFNGQPDTLSFDIIEGNKIVTQRIAKNAPQKTDTLVIKAFEGSTLKLEEPMVGNKKIKIDLKKG